MLEWLGWLQIPGSTAIGRFVQADWHPAGTNGRQRIQDNSCVSALCIKKSWRELQTCVEIACFPRLHLNLFVSWVLILYFKPAVPKLEKACWTSPDGCNFELQTGWVGRLLQLARMWWTIYGKSLSHLPSRLITFWMSLCIYWGDLKLLISKGRTIWNVLQTFLLATFLFSGFPLQREFFWSICQCSDFRMRLTLKMSYTVLYYRYRWNYGLLNNLVQHVVWF